jgi:hypothetical protein
MNIQNSLHTWYFWIGFQIFLFICLIAFGFLQGSGSVIPGSFERVLVYFLPVIIGFPLGILFFVGVGDWQNLPGLFTFVLVPLYYVFAIASVYHIIHKRAHWQYAALALFIVMMLNFIGCSQVVEFPIFYT